MNNPFQIMQAMQNPQTLLQSMMNDQRVAADPRARKTMELLQNHDTRGLQDMANNLCKEYGTTPDQVRQTLQNQLGF